MAQQQTDASDWVPETSDTDRLAAAATECRGCELWEPATQVVFGDGSKKASLVFVGEQPGDREDRAGEPFVGPAGRVLDEALEAAGIDRSEVWLTNAVKHFRHEQRGKRRIHRKPDLRHLVACHPWLDAELAAVRPRTAVALGATAARALLGRPVRIGEERGQVITAEGGPMVVVTTHPSALLRLRASGGYDEALEQLAGDLRLAAEA